MWSRCSPRACDPSACGPSASAACSANAAHLLWKPKSSLGPPLTEGAFQWYLNNFWDTEGELPAFSCISPRANPFLGVGVIVLHRFWGYSKLAMKSKCSPSVVQVHVTQVHVVQVRPKCIPVFTYACILEFTCSQS